MSTAPSAKPLFQYIPGIGKIPVVQCPPCPTGPTGRTGSTGPTGFTGPVGGTSGRILYFDTAGGTTPDTGELLASPNTGPTTTITTGTQPAGTYLLGTYTTPVGSTTDVQIADGIWTTNLRCFASDDTSVRYFVEIYYVDTTGVTETLIQAGNAGSAVQVFSVLNVVPYPLFVPATTLPDLTYRLRIKLYAVFSGSADITALFRDATNSFVVTTLSTSIVPGPTGPTGFTGPTGPTGATGGFAPYGNTLIVDAVYGNDTLGAASPSTNSFLTVNSALSNAASGQTVFVRPGLYLEKITMPAGVSLRGQSTQTVTIAQSNVSAATTLVTMGSNCRIEDITFNLTSASNVSLTGVDWPSGTSITSKFRTGVVNVISSGTGSNTIVGMLSAGTSATTYTSSDSIRSMTLNVNASSSGIVRGVYVTGSNYFSIRDMNINAQGSGPNIVGVETTNAGAYASIKHSTIRGGDASTNHFDINRTAGEILIGSVDLKNNTANGNGFSITTEGAITHYGTTGNFGNGSTFYLVPGFVKQGDLPLAPFPIPMTQNMILFSGTFQSSPAAAVGTSVKMSVYKNNVLTDMSMTILAGQTLASNTTQSVDYRRGDNLDIRMVPTGANFNGYNFAASFAFY